MYQPIRLYGLTGDPTQKQVERAAEISKLLGLSLPAEKSKQAYSDFINRHIRRYKEKLRGGKAQI